MTLQYESDHRDFIPHMRKISAREGIELVRTYSMNVADALRINGVYLTEDDVRWLNKPGYKYGMSSNQALGTIATFRVKLT